MRIVWENGRAYKNPFEWWSYVFGAVTIFEGVLGVLGYLTNGSLGFAGWEIRGIGLAIVAWMIGAVFFAFSLYNYYRPDTLEAVT